MHEGPMQGMAGMAAPPMNGSSGMDMHRRHKMMMMHMTFFWGEKTEILFSGWPGSDSAMYWVCLLFVFVLALLLEFLSHCTLIKPGSNQVSAGLVRTLMHAIRMGLAYMVMLAVMSFNGGLFLVAVAGHALGFLVFGTRVFKNSDLPPMSC